jgi:protein-S-isoprenylcysteine O-methyltransferase Ste14
VLDLAGVRQVMPVAGPAQPLKTYGVYGFVRHPLYFAWMLLVFGAPVMTMTRLTFAVFSTLYLAVAIPFEERSLTETFGRDYASYRRKVRWRMIPGIY